MTREKCRAPRVPAQVQRPRRGNARVTPPRRPCFSWPPLLWPSALPSPLCTPLPARPCGFRASAQPCRAPCLGASAPAAPPPSTASGLTQVTAQNNPRSVPLPTHNACGSAIPPQLLFSVSPHSPREWGTSQPSAGLHPQHQEHRQALWEDCGLSRWLSPCVQE